MTAPADRLRHLLTEAATKVCLEFGGDLDGDRPFVAALVDQQMDVFADVTAQPRRTARGPGGTWIREHRLVALTPFEPAKETETP